MQFHECYEAVLLYVVVIRVLRFVNLSYVQDMKNLPRDT
jgi:hypothetical protein